jgi:hypothetical protein
MSNSAPSRKIGDLATAEEQFALDLEIRRRRIK